jgi:hypothetical protein
LQNAEFHVQSVHSQDVPITLPSPSAQQGRSLAGALAVAIAIEKPEALRYASHRLFVAGPNLYDHSVLISGENALERQKQLVIP